MARKCDFKKYKEERLEEITKAMEILRLGPSLNEDVSAEYNDAVNVALDIMEDYAFRIRRK